MAARMREPQHVDKIFQRSCICRKVERDRYLQTNNIVSCVCIYVRKSDVHYLTHIDYNPHFRDQVEQFLSCVGTRGDIAEAIVIMSTLTNDRLVEFVFEKLRQHGIPYGMFVGKWPLNVTIDPHGRVHEVERSSVKYDRPSMKDESQFGMELYSRPYLRCERNKVLDL
ncbi:MAG TPA: hypothetical protein ENN11_02570 [Methanomicrobia archaeon]|nr:hypothetical protein [Methanomicrobia archaeon]